MVSEQTKKQTAVDSLQRQIDAGFMFLRFAPAYERLFKADYLTGAIPFRLLLIISSLGLLLITPSFEQVLNSPPGHAHFALQTQVYVIFPALMFALLVTWWPNWRRMSDFALVFSSVAVVLAVLAQRVSGAKHGFDVPLEYTATTIASVFFIGRVRFWTYFPVAFLLMLAMVANEWFLVQPALDGWYRVLVACVLVLLGIIGGYSLEYVLRASWLNEQRLIALSNHDPLTRLNNRRGFDETAQRALRQAIRQNKYFSVMLLDLDHFKAYNDTYGHAVGDDCLRTFARELEDSVKRPLDCCGRYGGEEFVAACFDCDPNAMVRMAEDLRQRVSELSITSPGTSDPTSITVSIGLVTLRPKRDDELDDLIEQADRMLYQAKAQGRNCVAVDESQLVREVLPAAE